MNLVQGLAFQPGSLIEKAGQDYRMQQDLNPVKTLNFSFERCFPLPPSPRVSPLPDEQISWMGYPVKKYHQFVLSPRPKPATLPHLLNETRHLPEPATALPNEARHLPEPATALPKLVIKRNASPFLFLVSFIPGFFIKKT